MKDLTAFIKESFNKESLNEALIKKDSKIDNLFNKPGAYACLKDLSLSNDDEFIQKNKRDVVGIAIIHKLSDNNFHRFVISKDDLDKDALGGYREDLSNCGSTVVNNKNDAFDDFNGKKNSEAIYNKLKDNKDWAGIKESPAIETCIHAFDEYGFNNKGYLPSLGEMKVVYDNKADINRLLKLVGRRPLRDLWYWCSTLLTGDNLRGYVIDLYDGNVVSTFRYYSEHRICAAMSLD